MNYFVIIPTLFEIVILLNIMYMMIIDAHVIINKKTYNDDNRNLPKPRKIINCTHSIINKIFVN
jgi:hypothetical protein